MRLLGVARKAEMGVGTLIIFIAMLLVAAVAAGVLLQTAGSLQQRALTTGQATRGEISTNARVIEVSAVDGSNKTLENFSIQMKLSPGSEPIKLEEVTLTLSTTTFTTTYVYSGNQSFSVNAVNSTGDFGVQYLINGSNHQEGMLQRGDVIRIHLASEVPIGEDAPLRLNFIPKVGTATLVEFNTPNVISTTRAYLYP
jgi:archaeal flagellin FlaB